jgi:hypothetical protein
MITIFNNLFALLPINYAFIIEKYYVKGNMCLILYGASIFRHSIEEKCTPNKLKLARTLDLSSIYILCIYTMSKNLLLIIPYTFMFLLHKYYLYPNIDEYKMSHTLAHVFGLHMLGSFVSVLKI